MFALVILTSAQDPQGKRTKRAGDDVLIRAAARLVEVSVVALDRHGNPVPDLEESEFTILERSEDQKIAAFYRHALLSVPAEPLPRGMVTNRLEFKGAPTGQATVIVLEKVFTQFEDAVYVRDQVIKFLKQIQPEDRIALLTLTRGGIRVIHDFTNDARSLLQSLDRLRPALSGWRESSGSQAIPEPNVEGLGAIEGIAEWFQAGQERVAQFEYEGAARAVGSALESIAHYLGRISGRKNVIWVSSLIPAIDPGGTSHAPVVAGAMRALSDASVAVYPVDARGLVGPFDRSMLGPPPDFDIRSRRDLVGPRSIGRISPTMRLSRSQDGMVSLAQATGGRHFINTNDIAGAIRTAIGESRVTYTLGYYPTHGKWDGSYREIQVKVKRPGVTIRHRRGYYAFPDPPSTPETIEEAMLAAAVSPLDATAIGLTAQMTPQEGAAGQRVTLTIEPEDVPLRLGEGRRRATLDVWYVLLDTEGAPHSIAKYPVEVSLDEAGWRAAQATGIREERYMEFPAEARALRIVVRDRATGVLGSLRMPLPQE
jgi:VWFA-related protein